MRHPTISLSDDAAQSTADLSLCRDGIPLLSAFDANTFVKRLVGLHARGPLAPNEALLIRPCRSIQTFGMRYSIDVAFLDGNGRVLEQSTVYPARIVSCLRACMVVEMTEGSLRRLELAPGQRLLPASGSWA